MYMVTPATNALFVINGKSRTVNCEIGGVLNPVDMVWTINRTHNYATSSHSDDLGNGTTPSDQSNSGAAKYQR